jgi:hypothetical protein
MAATRREIPDHWLVDNDRGMGLCFELFLLRWIGSLILTHAFPPPLK